MTGPADPDVTDFRWAGLGIHPAVMGCNETTDERAHRMALGPRARAHDGFQASLKTSPIRCHQTLHQSPPGWRRFD